MEKIVITGGPGCGKSSVLVELGRMGHLVLPEVFRWHKVLLTVESFGSVDGKSMRNRELIGSLLGFHRYFEDEDTADAFCFYDRCVLDLVAYIEFYSARRRSESTPDVLSFLDPYARRFANNIHKAFLIPLPATGIVQDWLRTNTFEEAQLIEQRIRQTYSDYNVDLVYLPKKEVGCLCDLILNHLNGKAGRDP